MNIDVKTKAENKLLGRNEVHFEVEHPKAATPNRSEVRKQLAAKLGAEENAVVIRSIHSHFGSSKSIGLAHVYKSEKELQSIEPKYIIARNSPKKDKKGEVPKEEAKAPEAA